MYAHRCDICGAFLDPGERCDCEERAKQEKEKAKRFEQELSKHIRMDKNGQLRLVF